MVPFVRSNQVLEINTESFAYPNYPNGISKDIQTDGTNIVGAFWRIPNTLGNRIIGWNKLVATDATKPRADAVKALRVKASDNTEYEMAIADNDYVASTSPIPDQFAYLANGLGGSLPVMPTVTIPAPILQSGPQSSDSNGRVFVFAFPANPNALLYAIPYPWFNGVAPTVPYAPSGITTAALFVTWANTSGKWDGYGTWSSVGDVVSLLNTDSSAIPLSFAGMQISLTAVHFCLTLNASPDNVNGIKIDGAIMPITPLSAGRTNRQDLINAIQKYFPGDTFTTLIANKIDVLTTRVPQDIRYNGGAVSGLTWAPGACS